MNDETEAFYLTQLPVLFEDYSLEERRRWLKRRIYDILSNPDHTNAHRLLRLRVDQSGPPTARDFITFLIDRGDANTFIDGMFALHKRKERPKRTRKALRPKYPKPRKYTRPVTRKLLLERKRFPVVTEESRLLCEEIEAAEQKAEEDRLRLLPYFAPNQ